MEGQPDGAVRRPIPWHEVGNNQADCAGALRQPKIVGITDQRRFLRIPDGSAHGDRTGTALLRIATRRKTTRVSFEAFR
jgi:hypothetical protein